MTASLDVLQRMYRYMAWADARTLTALRDNPDSPQQALETYAHILNAEHIWLSRIAGRPYTHGVFELHTLDACEALAAENRVAFLQIVDHEDRARAIAYETLSGARFATPLEDILIHVSQHGVYHRGQVALLIRAAGGTPLATDYIVFQREALHAT